MAQADQDGASLALLQELLAAPMEDHKGFTAFLPPHFHVVPAQLSADPGAKSLGNRLFGGKSRREEGCGNTVRQAIADLVRVQNPIEKPVAKPFVRGADAFDFDDIDAQAEDHLA